MARPRKRLTAAQRRERARREAARRARWNKQHMITVSACIPRDMAEAWRLACERAHKTRHAMICDHIRHDIAADDTIQRRREQAARSAWIQP